MTRQKKLKEILQTRYCTFETRPDCSVLYSSQYEEELQRIYRNLGGVLNRHPVRVGAYDICTALFAVELDEERHFNRYRAMTLNSRIYDYLPKLLAKDYTELCYKNEIKCLRAARWGGNWGNSSADSQFGQSSHPGDFEGNGSSRWKQRAYYDFLKDSLQLITDFPLVRVSIYDALYTTNGVATINDVLSSNNYLDYSNEIIEFIESKI